MSEISRLEDLYYNMTGTQINGEVSEEDLLVQEIASNLINEIYKLTDRLQFHLKSEVSKNLDKQYLPYVQRIFLRRGKSYVSNHTQYITFDLLKIIFLDQGFYPQGNSRVTIPQEKEELVLQDMLDSYLDWTYKLVSAALVKRFTSVVQKLVRSTNYSYLEIKDLFEEKLNQSPRLFQDPIIFKLWGFLK